MAFFDKLKEKTGDMIEITKINGKINDEKKKIAANKAALAEYYWKKFESGEVLDSEAAAICAAIVASNEAIQGYNQELQKIKEEPAPTAQKAPAAPAAAASSAVQPASPAASSAPPAQAAEAPVEAATTGESWPCQKCGLILPASIKFCPECGAPNVPPKPVKEDITCKNCGTLLEKGKKFCPECGTPVTPA